MSSQNTSPSVLVMNAKGGVGKSTIILLLAEYFLHRGKKIQLTDASENPTAKKYIDASRNLGRTDTWQHNDPEIRLIDTTGTARGAAPFLDQATIILAPFQPNADDSEEAFRVYQELPQDHKHKVIFVPTRLRNPGLTREQRAVVDSVEEAAGQVQALVLYGLSERHAVYPKFPLGLAENFFTVDETKAGLKKAQAESLKFCRAIEMILFGAAG